jgi:hypothetical protein
VSWENHEPEESRLEDHIRDEVAHRPPISVTGTAASRNGTFSQPKLGGKFGLHAAFRSVNHYNRKGVNTPKV